MFKYLPILKDHCFERKFIFAPFLAIGVINIILWLFFPESIQNYEAGPALMILFLALMIFDVPHVWSTIYKTYVDKNEFKRHKKLLVLTPLFSFIGLLVLVLYDTSLYFLFWVLAAIAAFHFIKQQVGFILLYSSTEKENTEFDRSLDKYIGWSITGFPLLYWFSNLDTRKYSWFSEYEFLKLPTELFPIAWSLFAGIVGVYIYNEYLRHKEGKTINLYKYTYILGTFFVWFYGIVWTNSMLLFGVGNMLLHGWNYMGIIYNDVVVKQERGIYNTGDSLLLKILTKKGIIFMMLPIVFIGIIEEYFWSLFTGNDIEYFQAIFGTSLYILAEQTPLWLFVIFISLLALPQTTHYFLDAFIWKKNYK